MVSSVVAGTVSDVTAATRKKATASQLLAAAVGAVPGGSSRPGQEEMAAAIERAVKDREHLLVQAGTGTGKSLAYLTPALLVDGPVVVSTATLALQNQLVEHDLPRLADAVEPVLARRPGWSRSSAAGPPSPCSRAGTTTCVWPRWSTPTRKSRSPTPSSATR